MDENRATIRLLCDDAQARTRFAAALEEFGEFEIGDQGTADVSVVWGQAAIDGECDAVLPEDCGDDELMRTAGLIAKLALARQDLRQTARSHARWEQLAATDPLTELPNRRAWDEAIVAALARSQRSGQSLCVAIVDLDRFKTVNDAAGHAVGDQVLRATGAGLRAAIRRDDFAARLGGDEFGLLLPELTAERAADVLERIRRRVLKAIDEAGTPTTCSIGYASGGAGEDAAELFRRADAALLRAKQAGRDRVSD